jgi:hypothetical protein
MSLSSRIAGFFLATALIAAPVPKEVLAFYYGWYGNPQMSGSRIHWKQGISHTPVLGEYDSHDPKVVEEHCREAKAAGITGFIASWWQRGDIHDKGMPLLLDAAQKNGLKVSAYYEEGKPIKAATVEATVEDILFLLGRYGKHPAWLKVNGKPVLFVYVRAVHDLKLPGWRQVIAGVNRKYPGGAIFIGDELSEKGAQVFDGIHTYNITGKTKGMTVEQVHAWGKENYPAVVKMAGSKISAVTVIPGYDDSHIGRPDPRPNTDRHDGQTYRALWEEAIAAHPNWVLITSWNEWHEGSEIEPSKENGDRELKTTKEYAPLFLK